MFECILHVCFPYQPKSGTHPIPWIISNLYPYQPSTEKVTLWNTLRRSKHRWQWYELLKHSSTSCYKEPLKKPPGDGSLIFPASPSQDIKHDSQAYTPVLSKKASQSFDYMPIQLSSRIEWFIVRIPHLIQWHHHQGSKPQQRVVRQHLPKWITGGTVQRVSGAKVGRLNGRDHVKVECYIKGEEKNAEKKAKEAKERGNINSDQCMNYYMPPTRDKGTFKRNVHLETFTLLNARREHILQEVYHSKVIKDPPTLYSSMMGPDTGAWCKYHSFKGHTTHECLHLKREIERMIQQGQLRRYINKKVMG